jgi:hypothetical protein
MVLPHATLSVRVEPFDTLRMNFDRRAVEVETRCAPCLDFARHERAQ